MRFNLALLLATLLATVIASTIGDPRHVVRIEGTSQSDEHDLFKRKGGGGGGGRGGGGGSGGKGGSSGGSGSSGSGGSGGSSGSGGSGGTKGGSGSGKGGSGSSGSSGNRSPSSNVGGTSAGGSGPRPQYGGGQFYGGGARTPYRAGSRSPVGGIVPIALLGGAAALAFWPGIWLYGAYLYPYHQPYRFHNESSNRNETLNVICGCGTYDVCGCDDNNNTEYFTSLVGNGSYDALNKSVVNVAMVNGTNSLLINGSLPNGTTADDPNASSSSAASMRTMVQMIGFWPAVAAVLVAVFMA
ncbi:hypothetical protein ACSS6W_004672 [Trichoderma asperelloides]|uniref:DUF7732 domain-containing protein n=1 Tax=Trichoderma asperellum TaxID=101201 RepID=A0A6V8QWJ8_TRIAP|nr:hypothetical protein LI328DRAFT_126254 [Trichoderma asperelloides]GFP56809.1 hypothetical protein TASIC1_0007030100 [Trichoderma asperellum]